MTFLNFFVHNFRDKQKYFVVVQLTEAFADQRPNQVRTLCAFQNSVLLTKIHKSDTKFKTNRKQTGYGGCVCRSTVANSNQKTFNFCICLSMQITRKPVDLTYDSCWHAQTKRSSVVWLDASTVVTTGKYFQCQCIAFKEQQTFAAKLKDSAQSN